MDKCLRCGHYPHGVECQHQYRDGMICGCWDQELEDHLLDLESAELEDDGVA